MRTVNQIYLDKFIAKPLAFVLNFFVRLLGKILRIDHGLNKEFKTIAVAKFKGMGSILQSTRMLNALRAQFPAAKIIFVSVEGNRGILEKIDCIDEIVTVDDSSMWKFAVTNVKSLIYLMRIRPEVYFDLEIYSDYSTIFTTFTLSKNRIGFYLRSSSFRLGIYTHMMFYNPRVPISKVYLQMAKLLGCNDLNAKMTDLRTSGVAQKPYIVVNVNASDLRLERRWDQGKFVDLIKLIRLAYPEFDIELIGSKSEQAYTETIQKVLDDEDVRCSAGKTNLTELIGLIDQAELMVTNDTGPMHIAFCTQTPVICLFGPCSPDQYGHFENATIIYKPMYCSPCVHEFEIPPCKGNNQCMKQISVQEVFEAVKESLDGISGKNESEKEVIYATPNDLLGTVER